MKDIHMELLALNGIAFLSIVVPVCLFIVFNWFGLGILGVVIGLTLWCMPGGNYGCIHMFNGGWIPFVISYPFGLYLLLESDERMKKESTTP